MEEVISAVVLIGMHIIVFLFLSNEQSFFLFYSSSVITTLSQAPKTASGAYFRSNINNGGAGNQDWTIGDLSATSLTAGGSSRSASNLIKSSGSGYGSNSVALQQDNLSDGASYGGSSYGNTAKSVAPLSFDNGGNYGGSSYGNTAKSVASVSFDNGGNNGGSSYGNTAKSVATVVIIL